MKKWIVGLVGLAIVASGGASAVSEQKVSADDFNGTNKFAFAEYVSEANAPEIDGKIDEDGVWGDYVLETGVTTSKNGDVTFGDVYILWNETGLYFLVDIMDDTVCVSDLCNLWVSETYYEERYADRNIKYPEVEGAYYLCINPEGENTVYKPDSWSSYIDMTGLYDGAVTITKDAEGNDIGYVVEVYVPLTGSDSIYLGESIGFDISIDSYLAQKVNPGVEDRDDYVNWNGNDDAWYWESPTALGEIILVDNDIEEGVVPPSPIVPDSSSTSESEQNSVGVEENTSSEGEDGQTSSVVSMLNCASTLVAIPASVFTALAVLVLAKKNKKEE